MTQIKTRNQHYIKSENRKLLIGYFLFQIVIFAAFIGHIDLNLNSIDADRFFTQFKNSQGFILLASSLFVIIMEGILPNSIKEIIVFWRFKNRLPGHRAFSHVCSTDSRINMEKLKSLFPEGFPVDPKEQNNEWYLLYRRFRNNPQVFHSHKIFILTRDLSTLTLMLVPLATLCHYLFGSSPTVFATHLSLLLIIFFIITISAHNYGKRFVANVMVESIID